MTENDEMFHKQYEINYSCPESLCILIKVYMNVQTWCIILLIISVHLCIYDNSTACLQVGEKFSSGQFVGILLQRLVLSLNGVTELEKCNT